MSRIRWKKEEYAYPQYHSRKPEHRLKRGDLVRIEVGHVSLEAAQKGKFKPVGNWKYLGLGNFLGCASRKDQMPVFRLPKGRIIGGCECWWTRFDVARQIEQKVLLPEAAEMAAETAEAISRVLKVRPLHVRASGDFEALIEWKVKLLHDNYWFSMFAAPSLGKIGPKLARMIAKRLKTLVCGSYPRNLCKHIGGHICEY